MKNQDIEIWALRVIKQAQSGQPSEDRRTELKRQWPDDYERAARRIAGHANSAGRGPILWLIGVDEKTGDVAGADHIELSKWLAGVHGEFDGIPPTCHDLNIAIGDLTVVALVFESDRTPYLVKNPHHGKCKGDPMAWEVPWREGNETRTARHSDLLSILSEKLSLKSLAVELQWNQQVAARNASDYAQFRAEEFWRHQNGGDLPDRLEKRIYDLVMEAYLTVSSASSLQHTLETTSDQLNRSMIGQTVIDAKQRAAKAIAQALNELEKMI